MSAKFASAAAAVVAALLGFAAIAVFRSGGRGPLVILGLVFGLGAVALAVFAFRLYAREPSPSGRRRGPVVFSRGQRLGLIAIGVMAFAMGVSGLATGSIKLSKSAASRHKDPGGYWQLIFLHFGTSATLLYLGLRKSPTDGDGHDPQGRRDKGGGTDSRHDA